MREREGGRKLESKLSIELQLEQRSFSLRWLFAIVALVVIIDIDIVVVIIDHSGLVATVAVAVFAKHIDLHRALVIIGRIRIIGIGRLVARSDKFPTIVQGRREWQAKALVALSGGWLEEGWVDLWEEYHRFFVVRKRHHSAVQMLVLVLVDAMHQNVRIELVDLQHMVFHGIDSEHFSKQRHPHLDDLVCQHEKEESTACAKGDDCEDSRNICKEQLARAAMNQPVGAVEKPVEDEPHDASAAMDRHGRHGVVDAEAIDEVFREECCESSKHACDECFPWHDPGTWSGDCNKSSEESIDGSSQVEEMALD
eukprot:comp20666_c0_seq1/m.42244 comp20666_c0_seq1/g.42244  ORF comp20666_c0_seq1/g.42244 comp20666_c0_seq1/m.42244 type:complete len:311 (+) comp20666_c0_seq1:18-950(+)